MIGSRSKLSNRMGVLTLKLKEQLWWQQFLWIFHLAFFYITYVLLIALTANLVDFRS